MSKQVRLGKLAADREIQTLRLLNENEGGVNSRTLDKGHCSWTTLKDLQEYGFVETMYFEDEVAVFYQITKQGKEYLHDV